MWQHEKNVQSFPLSCLALSISLMRLVHFSHETNVIYLELICIEGEIMLVKVCGLTEHALWYPYSVLWGCSVI